MVKQKFLIAPLVLILLPIVISFPSICLPSFPGFPKWEWMDLCYRWHSWPLCLVRPTLSVYTKDRENVKQIFTDDSDIPAFVKHLETNGYLNSNRRVIFVVHGYMWNVFTTWPEEMAKSLAHINDENNMAIAVNWWFGGDWDFPEAASNTKTVAKFIAKFAAEILDSQTFQGDKSKLYLHCVGHSLGAHICGQAGRDTKIFDRATGLDPAGPGFETCDDHMNINTDSADCVDNIHTDGTSEGHSSWNPLSPLVSHYGTMKEWGHLDFYPNGGFKQPGCGGLTSWTWCSHSRVTDLFMYTIAAGRQVCPATGCVKPDGKPCDKSNQHMGYYSACHSDNKNITQLKYSLTTEDKAPFC